MERDILFLCFLQPGKGPIILAESYRALRRNPTGWLIDGFFRYTLQFEKQRVDEDSGMAVSVSARAAGKKSDVTERVLILGPFRARRANIKQQRDVCR